MPVLTDVHLGEGDRGTGGAADIALGLEQLDRAGEARTSRLAVRSPPRHATRPRLGSVSYATWRSRSWRNPYWPRSGERGSSWIERTSLRTSACRTSSSSPLGAPASEASAVRVKVLPSTDASWMTLRSAGASP